VSEPNVTKFQGITAHSLKQNSKDPMCPKCFWRGSEIIEGISVINSSTTKRQTGFQASDMWSMRTAFFWVITKQVVVTPLSTFQDNLWVPSSRIPEVKKGSTGHPETSVRNCHSPQCNNPGERNSHYQVGLHTNIPAIYCKNIKALKQFCFLLVAFIFFLLSTNLAKDRGTHSFISIQPRRPGLAGTRA